MSAHVLVNGTLHRAPESRTSKAGNAFVMATIRERDGDGSRFWRIFAFGETARGELERLREGDALCVQGAMRAEIFTPDGGEARVSLSVTADHVLALRPPAKSRQPRERREDSAPPAGPAGPDDEIPF